MDLDIILKSISQTHFKLKKNQEIVKMYQNKLKSKIVSMIDLEFYRGVPNMTASN